MHGRVSMQSQPTYVLFPSLFLTPFLGHRERLQSMYEPRCYWWARFGTPWATVEPHCSWLSMFPKERVPPPPCRFWKTHCVPSKAAVLTAHTWHTLTRVRGHLSVDFNCSPLMKSDFEHLFLFLVFNIIYCPIGFHSTPSTHPHTSSPQWPSPAFPSPPPPIKPQLFLSI